MPLYEYACEKCGKVFEVMQKMADPLLTVHEECGGKLERMISAPALHFKGTGFYITDYAKGSGSSNAPGKSEGGKNSEGKASSEASKSEGSKSEGSTKSEGSKSESSKSDSGSSTTTSAPPSSPSSKTSGSSSSDSKS